jgi:hypothetical protein
MGSSTWGAVPRAQADAQDPFGGIYVAKVAYAWPSAIAQGSRELGDVDTLETRATYLAVYRPSSKYAWYAGLDYRGYFFDAPARSPIPDALHAVSVELGSRWKVHPKWELEFRLNPGLYSDLEDLDDDDFNVPVMALATYSLRPNLQLLGGASVNVWRDVPVIPGLGLRWSFADPWTLLLAYPVPRLQYDFDDRLSAHVGVEFARPAFRVRKDFGDRVGRPELTNEIVSFGQWRVGTGLTWRVQRGLALALEAGWLVDRRFHFDDEDLLLNGDGAPFVQFGLSGSY